MAARLSPTLSRWSLGLLWAEALAVALPVLAIGLAVVVAVADESDHTDEWDGLGTFIALFVGGFALVCLVPLVVMLLWTVRARRRHDPRGVRGSAVLAATLAGLYLVAIAGAVWPSSEATLWLPLAVPGLVLLPVAVGTYLASDADVAADPRAAPGPGPALPPEPPEPPRIPRL